MLSLALAACGGGGGGGGGGAAVAQDAGDGSASVAAAKEANGTTSTATGSTSTYVPANAIIPTTVADAVRLADQATFGPTEALVKDIQAKGPSAWLVTQLLSAPSSRYTSGSGAALHQSTAMPGSLYCNGRDVNCWRDNFSTDPLLWDFYRNAMTQPDQLRQRVAFALQQILVISGNEVYGTYGVRNYYNNLLDLAFGNYRDVLKKVTLSPVMGDYLNNVNNNKAAPNENYARELLQLFSIGTCKLNLDGSLTSGQCIPTYDNQDVRSYAYALTGWTYPAGGSDGAAGCYPSGTNCRYYNGDMTPLARFHDTESRTLLSGVSLPAGHTAQVALEKVLDSLMAHPNTAPFIAKQLIQRLVSSNPSPAYVQRVASAFKVGKYKDFGDGRPGALGATVAAILLDEEARGASVGRSGGKLREPAMLFTGVLRAMYGHTDGEALGWWWGKTLRQHVFRPISVFNFYSPNNAVPGGTLKSPEFALHETSTAIERLNFLTYLIDWGGSAANASVPNAVGTGIDVSNYLGDAENADKLVDRLATFTLGAPLTGAVRTAVVDSVAYWTPARDSANWKKYRVNTAAYLIFALPQYQVQR